MHNLLVLAAITVLTTRLLAAPTPEEVIPEGAFSVSQVHTGKYIFKSGPVEMMKTYKKFKKPVPASIEAAVAALSQPGTVIASPTQYDREYVCPVTVGSNVLYLDFDTGSSDLWVFSNLMTVTQQSGHHIYNTGTGVSLQGRTFNIGYADGSGATGNVYADKVAIGAVTATSMEVEAATSASSSFANEDGLLGLGFPNINRCYPKQCTPFMQRIASTLPAKLFTTSLKKGKYGSYDFGYISSSKFTGAITYTPVNTGNGYWEFTAGGYQVGSLSYTMSIDCIADTGTTLVYLPDEVCNNYYRNVYGATNTAYGWIFPCSSSLPSLGVVVSGVSHTIPGNYLNYAPYSGSSCYGGLQSSSFIGFSILGDVFLKSQFVVFDIANTKIGFATPSSL